jgi:hypothetical protein
MTDNSVVSEHISTTSLFFAKWAASVNIKKFSVCFESSFCFEIGLTPAYCMQGNVLAMLVTK